MPLILLSAALVALMTRLGTLDRPGARSSHARPTPKGGGVGIVAALIAGVLSHGTDRASLALVAATAWIAAISYADDVRSFSFAVKLGAQLAASLLVVACGIHFSTVVLPWLGGVPLGWAGPPLTLAWFLFVTNALNFIDGLNGLASGTAAIACLALAAAGADGLARAAALSLAAGIAGFLPFNYPRARIFMGDVGSQACGFVLAALGVLVARVPGEVLVVPMVLFAVLFDVAFTLLRRALAGERVTQAHRGHLYQLANRCGMPAWRVSLLYWAMAAIAGALCLAGGGAPGLAALVWPLAGTLPVFLWLLLAIQRARSADIGRW